MLNVNDFKNMVSTKESRKRCIERLSYDERKMLLQFIKSVEKNTLIGIKREYLND